MSPRVALVHDWLTGMRGGEKVLEVLCEMYPQSDIFTLVHVPGSVSAVIEAHRIRTSWLQHVPLAARYYRQYLPLFPILIVIIVAVVAFAIGLGLYLLLQWLRARGGGA